MIKMMIPALLIASVACSKADFGSGGAKRQGAVLPTSGQANPPLDVSKVGDNDQLDENGPRAGEGEQLSKTIELGCDNQQGVIIDVGGGGKASLLGDPNAGVPTKGGKDIDIDKDGDPVGEDGGKIGGGKDGGGKGEEPLPPAPPETVPEQARVITTVKGRFCPTSNNKLTVLFVVDYSGSMGRHVPQPGLPEIPGNDPQINGSCGRLRAAQAILGRIGSEMKPGDTVEVGMVPFAGGIVTNRILDIRGLAEFGAQVSKDTFCQYVVQAPSFGYDPVNAGGIDGGAVNSSTNYRAAFTAARSALTNVYGRKVVYFISDGEPTSGGIDPVRAGIEAGEALRLSVDNLTLNGLLLGNTGPAAQAVLEQVAGAPERVRRAESADELAEAILDFPAATIDESSGLATLSVAPYPKTDLGLQFLTKDPAQGGVWIYETQPFVLLGRPGEEVMNIVEVTAHGADGSTHSSIVKIRYRQ